MSNGLLHKIQIKIRVKEEFKIIGIEYSKQFFWFPNSQFIKILNKNETKEGLLLVVAYNCLWNVGK